MQLSAHFKIVSVSRMRDFCEESVRLRELYFTHDDGRSAEVLQLGHCAEHQSSSTLNSLLLACRAENNKLVFRKGIYRRGFL